MSSTPALQSLLYDSSMPSLAVLDQRLIPKKKAYINVRTTQDAWRVIREMHVRGAPLIAIVAALGLAIETNARQSSFGSEHELRQWIEEATAYLRSSRPTAVNLFAAMDEILALSKSASRIGRDSVAQEVKLYGERLLGRDIETNRAIGNHGAHTILTRAGGSSVKVLTHCNTGSLATAGYGTALGIIRALHARQRLDQVYCTETRPYNQGARLTAFELLQDGLPGVLITDSMAAALMQTKGLDAIIVGADRVASNGDTANKIGTYQLAVLAKYHNVPFYVAAPLTSLDLSMETGREIVIEERKAEEVRWVEGQQVAPDDMPVWNPAFDVTPASLITAIVTERGSIFPTQRKTKQPGQPCDVYFDLRGLVHQQQGGYQENGGMNGHVNGEHLRRDEGELVVGDGKRKRSKSEVGSTPPWLDSVMVIPPDYKVMDASLLAQYIHDAAPQVYARLGARSVSELKVVEVGDGNLNLVFIVQGPKDSVVVKQALPYVRCCGESWPMTLERAFFEHAALVVEYDITPSLVPEVYHFDRRHGLIIMRYIEPPHIILRKALIQGQILPTVAHDLATFLAHNLFYTSTLHLTGAEKRKQVAFWSGNASLCQLTEAVVFTEPYIATVAHNRHTCPYLDEDVKRIRADLDLRVIVAQLKAKFIDSTEALLHGDLHTGSVMVKAGSTFMIDPEFAFYGPMGFEIGAILGNFILNYCAQDGHHNQEGFGDWVLQQAVILWNDFERQFRELWEDENAQRGDLFTRAAFESSLERHRAQDVYLRQLFIDSLGFAGCKMIRRIIGISHVEDLESIKEAAVRATCERKALGVARTLVVDGNKFTTMQEIAEMVRRGG